ncbi:T9SS type A sorting domain-containing protein [bacterium]|nr:T9SS type A sorting domain-containing protein [bacterium]
MRKIFIIIFILTIITSAMAQRGITTRFPEGDLTPVEMEASERPTQPLPDIDNPTREYRKPAKALTAIDSIEVEVMLQPGEYQGIFVDVEAGTLGYTAPAPLVDEELLPYIQTAPEFLQKYLYLNLQDLDPFAARAYTGILDEANPLWRDEIFYCLAHLGAEMLMDWYRADLILENVREMYRADSFLAYVEIVDMGSPGEPDHYTYTRYVTTDTGMTGYDTVAIDPEMYYRYVMFPKITEELPAYINPSTGSVDVTHGHFWRTWFWDVSETTASTTAWPLGDSLMSTNALWRGVHNNDSDNGAVGIVTRWIKDCLEFDSGTERPVQPVRIYGLHMGRCGEHEDITCAAARVGLIPSNGIESLSTDHVWNEFWNGWRWAGWEPVNTYVDNAWVYSDGWGKQFATVLDHTGDGRMVPVTERYSHEIATLELNVRDDTSRPVDGAKIMLAAEGDGGIFYDCVLYTNSRGKAFDYVGDGKHMYWRVDSEIGCNPEPGYVSNLVTSTGDGSHYNRTMTLPGTLDYLDWSLISPTSSPTAYIKTRLDPVSEFIKYNGTFEEIDVTYYYRHDDPFGFEFFVLSDLEYAVFVSESPFQVYAMEEATDSGYFEVPVENEPYWVVVSNIANIANTIVGKLSVALTDTTSGIEDNYLPESFKVSVYPNPFNGALRISAPPISQIEIFDINGRMVDKITNNGYNKTDILWQPEMSLSTGIYLVRINSEDKVTTRRVVYLK